VSDTALITSQNAAAGASPRRCQWLVIEGPDAGRAVALGNTVLARAGGNLSEAARQAGVDRKHFRTLSRRHGLIPATEEQENG